MMLRERGNFVLSTRSQRAEQIVEFQTRKEAHLGMTATGLTLFVPVLQLQHPLLYLHHSSA